MPRRGRPPRTSYNHLMTQTTDLNESSRVKSHVAALLAAHQPPANSCNLRHPPYSSLDAQPHAANASGAPYRIPTRRSQRFANSRASTQPGIINTQLVDATPTQAVSPRYNSSQAPTTPSSQLSTQHAQPAAIYPQASTVLNPSICQHPKHLKYNPDGLEPSKPRRGRPPRGTIAGLPVTIPVPRRLKEVLELPSGSRICNTCKRLTDLDEEYIIDPRYKGPE